MADPQTFGELIQALADRHHEGHLYRIATRLGVSPSLPYFWRNGTVKQPLTPQVIKLCEAYDLKYWDVMKLILTPAPKRSRGRKALGVLLLAATIGGVLPGVGTLLLVENAFHPAPYRKRRRGTWTALRRHPLAA